MSSSFEPVRPRAKSWHPSFLAKVGSPTTKPESFFRFCPFPLMIQIPLVEFVYFQMSRRLPVPPWRSYRYFLFFSVLRRGQIMTGPHHFVDRPFDSLSTVQVLTQSGVFLFSFPLLAAVIFYFLLVFCLAQRKGRPPSLPIFPPSPTR